MSFDYAKIKDHGFSERIDWSRSPTISITVMRQKQGRREHLCSHLERYLEVQLYENHELAQKYFKHSAV